MPRYDILDHTPSPAADPSPASHPSHPRLAVGQRVRWGGRPGIIIAIHGEQSPETCETHCGVLHTGGTALFDIALPNHITRGVPESGVRCGATWEILWDKPLATPEEIAAATTAALESEAAAKRADEDKAAANAAERAALPAKFPWLRPVAGSGKSDHAMGSANLKAHLQHEFPGHKFSVKSESYSGGDSINVRWELGPTAEQVHQITSLYVEGRFDSMTDCYEDNDCPFHQVFGGARHVFTTRSVGDQFEHVLAAIGEQIAIQGPTCHGRHGHTWDQWSKLSAARTLVLHTAYPPGAQIIGARLLTPSEREAEPSYEYPQSAFKVLFKAPAAAQPQSATSAMSAMSRQSSPSGIELSFCSERNHVRLKFPSKPDEAVRTRLKKAGFRWYGPAGVWYSKHTPKTEAAAREFLAPSEVGRVSPGAPPPSCQPATPATSHPSDATPTPPPADSSFHRNPFLRRHLPAIATP